MSLQAMVSLPAPPFDTPAMSDEEDALDSTDSSVSAEEEEFRENDIAVIGFACRAPGGNNSPEQLWEFLLNKGDACGDIPEMRWAPYMTRQPGNSEILAETTSRGYFLDKLEDFDAAFFGISPREAELIDPQQRIALEVAWEALEAAGVPAHTLAGSDAAVFMGVGSDDYSRLLLEDLPNVEAWMGVGTAFCGVPNRISYLLDLMGPSIAVDAACASSLVAIHQGRQSLINRETSIVIAGGVNALAGPGLTRVLDKAGAIAKDGRCRSFDDSAGGYGRGEGAGVVIMKRISDAINDGDHILAVLKGSATGADGKTNGIMAPNKDAQERVARYALKEAGLSAEAIGYVEAHATSTPVGDPIECAAMAAVYGFGARPPSAPPCYVGSIKSNIGHLEAGAGVMGFIKAIMAVQKGIIPPQVNLYTPSTKIDWKRSKLEPVITATEWKSTRIRRAAIASYGYGGSVSHAVIEAAPFVTRMKRNSRVSQGLSTILVISAPQELRIKNVASDLASWLSSTEEGNSADLDSVAYTLGVKRHHHKFRATIVAADKAEAIDLLRHLSEGKTNIMISTGRTQANKSVWVFSGHGAQWNEMGIKLLDTEPIFKEIIETLEPIIQREMGFSAIQALKSGDFESVDKIQILTFAMQVGLAALIKANGITPKAIVGHSLGEIAASVVAGALSIREGALVCCIRARLYRQVAGQGAMYLVDMPMEEANERLRLHPDVVVAIDSSSNSCVISGPVDAVETVASIWKAENYRLQRVKSDVAFHSPSLGSLEAPLRADLAGLINPSKPTIPLYSTSLEEARGTALRDVDYWVDNMIKPVRLTTAILDAAADGYRTFLEISTHPIITHSLNETLIQSEILDARVIPTMLRNKDVRKSLLNSLGKLHCSGERIEFKETLAGDWIPSVPGTKWAHQPFWRQVTDAAVGRSVGHDAREHILLGGRTQLNGTKSNITTWSTYLNSQLKPFPGNHPLHGSEIVPAAVLLNTFLAAVPGHALKNVALRVPVVVEPPREVQVLLEDDQMTISSRLVSADAEADMSWITNTKSYIAQAANLESFGKIHLCELKQRCTRRLANTFSIDYLANVGVSEMGFPWKVLEHFENDTAMLALVHTDPEAEETETSKKLSPTSWASMLDAATSVSSTIFYKEPLLRMPTAIASVTLAANTIPPKEVYIYVSKSAEEFAADILIFDTTGNVVVEIETLKFAGIEGVAGDSQRDLVYKIVWPPVQLAEEPLNFSKVVFIGEQNDLILNYESQLSKLAIETCTVSTLNGLDRVDADTVFVMVAGAAVISDDIYTVSEKNCQLLLDSIKHLAERNSEARLFCITDNVATANGYGALSQSALLGLARIAQSEEGEIFKGLIDVEDASFPLQTLKYVQGVDVIRIHDSVARNARLRPFPANKSGSASGFRIRQNGTYLITGGLGALGLEVANYLASQGAKRLVLVSRRRLAPRSSWRDDDPETAPLRLLEEMGVSIYPAAVDMCTSSARSDLQELLDTLPPVLGVVHAAGTLANQPVLETTSCAFNSVISPKINGAVTLHQMFPPKTLDFMVLFSSCGQLLGFPGQAAYASGNAFLDAMATHRKSLGDNTISMMWTSWRSLGMASSTRYIDAELHARGITDITRDEAFVAWEQIFDTDTDHAVVLHARSIEADEPLPHPILKDILVRREKSAAQSGNVNGGTKDSVDAKSLTGKDLEVALTKIITTCVAATLSLPEENIPPNVALLELGMDSVMTVGLRMKLQQALKVKVGPTLIWNCPTVSHLVQHFIKEREG